MNTCRWIVCIALGVGCGKDGSSPVDASSATDVECLRTCDDGQFCNGVEQCAPDDSSADEAGCVDGDPPCESSFCDETQDRCSEECPDADGDGETDAACGGRDCDDSDANRFVGNTEVCDDGHDEDCDPHTLGTDADEDGYAAEACCNGSECGLDCNDSSASINPEAVDACGGGDEDCDGDFDENPSEQFYRDRDGDGFGVPDDVITACSAPDGYAPLPTDCDDDVRNINPSTPEVCDGSVDEDCDSMVDEGCPCILDATRPCADERDGIGICKAGTQTCGSTGWGACVDSVEPRIEVCTADGLDEDCDSTVDENCDCINGTTRRCGIDTGACRSVLQTCVNGMWPRDCSSEPGVIEPEDNEVCDGGTDEDCDTIVDEGCACANGSTRDCGTDTGVCEFGTQTCSGGAWGSCVGGTSPTSETCNGSDEDCDGVPDNADLDIPGLGATCGSNTGECRQGTQSCNGSSIVCGGTYIGPSDEVCDHENDDCDGRFDEGRWQASCSTDARGSGMNSRFSCLPGGCFPGGALSRVKFNDPGSSDNTGVAAYFDSAPGGLDWAWSYRITADYILYNGVGAALLGVMLTPNRTGGTTGNWGMPSISSGRKGYAVMYNPNPFIKRVEIWELTTGDPEMVASSAMIDNVDCWSSTHRAMDVTMGMSTNYGIITGWVELNVSENDCTNEYISVQYNVPSWSTTVYGEDSAYPRYHIAAVGGSRDSTEVDLLGFNVSRPAPSLTWENRGFCSACPW